MTFEAEYYESSAFWSNGMIEDAANIRRLEGTFALVPADTRKLIDVGCGNGVFARLVKQHCPDMHVTCVDRSAAALDHVQADDKQRCEIVDLPFGDRVFDCVTCLEVLEHLMVPDFRKALAELTRIARSTVIIGVPFNEAIDKNVDTCPQCRTVFNRDLHLRGFDDVKFSSLLGDFGFRLEERSIPVVNTHYLGFRTYYRLQRMLKGVPDQSHRFLSPICPLCGYIPSTPGSENLAPEQTRASAVIASTTTRNGVMLRLVKRYWPKQTTPGYWIVGRFVRSQGLAT